MSTKRLKCLCGIAVGMLCASSVFAQENLTTGTAQAAKLLDLTTVTAIDAPAAAVVNTPDFAADSWSFQTYGSATVGAPQRGRLCEAHVGVGYYFVDNISFNFEALGIGSFARDRDSTIGHEGIGGGFDLLFRWHFLQGDGWSIYGEGGAGLMQLTEAFPANGTSFNFSPQVGVGLTVRVYENLRFMGGARYQHVSNAGTRGPEKNPGYDAAMLYAGLMLPF